VLPADLIERVAKGDSEDPGLAPLYEDAVRDSIERFEATEEVHRTRQELALVLGKRLILS
jgi:hypothetical protein